MALGDLLSRLRGFSTPFGGVSWNPPTHDREVAQQLMTFLYDRRVLHAPSEVECPSHVIDSVLQIRKELTSLAQKLPPRSKLELKFRAMRGVCIHFLDRVQRDETIVRFGGQAGHWANWEFIDSLGQWRAFMAVYLGMISESYKIDPPAFLANILPEVPAPDKATRRSKVDGGLHKLIEHFAALPFDERQSQIEAANQYLSSPEGQREFGHLFPKEAEVVDAAPAQGLHR